MQIIHKKKQKKKKRRKFVRKKLVCVSSSHPTCLFQQLLKIFFICFIHASHMCIWILAQLRFHRDRCVPVVSVCGHPDQNVFHRLRYAKYFSYASIETGVRQLYQSVVIRTKMFSTCSDMQSISVTLPSRPVCVFFCKLCFFCKYKRSYQEKTFFFFNFQHFQHTCDKERVTWRGNTASWHDQKLCRPSQVSKLLSITFWLYSGGGGAQL